MKSTNQEIQDRVNKFKTETNTLLNKLIDTLTGDTNKISKLEMMKYSIATATVLVSLLTNIKESMNKEGLESKSLDEMIDKLTSLIEGFQMGVGYQIAKDVYSESE